MANFSKVSFTSGFLFLMFTAQNVYAGTISLNLDSKKIFLFIIIITAVFFLIGLVMLISYLTNIKRENIRNFYTNLENMWNSPAMIEARHKAPEYITENLLLSDKEEDKISIKNARFIIDFFNHIGLQIYEGLMDFSYFYNLLGDELLDYWDNKNFRYLVVFEKSKTKLLQNKYDGIEYLVELCYEQNSYRENSAYFLSSKTVPVRYRMDENINIGTRYPLQVKNKNDENTSGTLNVLLIISSILAGFVFVIFIYFYFNYMFGM